MNTKIRHKKKKRMKIIREFQGPQIRQNKIKLSLKVKRRKNGKERKMSLRKMKNEKKEEEYCITV